MKQDSPGTVIGGSAYIANLWEYPELTLAIFGLQVHEAETGAVYEASGIEAQIRETLSREPGLLCVRTFEEGSGGLELHYWRSHRDLAGFSKRLPHMKWWRWLMDHDGQGLSFYHEIYQCRTAEAVFQKGTRPIGPGTFCTLTPTDLGGNRSQQRQDRFEQARQQMASPSRAGGVGSRQDRIAANSERSTTMTTTSPAQQHIQNSVDTFNRHDAGAFAALYAESAVVSDPFYPEPLTGRAAIEKDMTDLFRAFPDITASQREVFERGDLLAGDFVLAGTHTGPLASPDGDIAPTGRRVSFGVAHVTRLNAEGLAVEDRRYYDVAGLLAQLGISP